MQPIEKVSAGRLTMGVLWVARVSDAVSPRQEGADGVPRLTWRSPRSVLYTISPVAGRTMASRWAVLIRGNSRPLLVLCKSKSAEGFGVEPPITIWAYNPL